MMPPPHFGRERNKVPHRRLSGLPRSNGKQVRVNDIMPVLPPQR